MSKAEEDKLEERLGEIARKLYEDSPELQEIIDKVNSGELDESEAMAQMMRSVSENAELETSLTTFAKEEMANIESDLKAQNPALFQAASGLPKLDPMFEARLYERIQFDEDAPELRVGPLPPGVKPAVPVLNASPNPVALGAALKNASTEMDAEIAALLETGGQRETALTKTGHSNLPQPTGYQPGALPTLVNVAVPSGAALALFTVPENQELAWSAAVTTQGRRSASMTIQRLITEHLGRVGFDVKSRNMVKSTEGILAKATWTFSIAGSGAESTQSNFSPVSNAAAAIANEIANNFTGSDGMVDISTPLWFEITTVDLIDERQVGWAALVRSR